MTLIKDKVYCKLTTPPEVHGSHGWCDREKGHEDLCKCPCGVEYKGVPVTTPGAGLGGY